MDGVTGEWRKRLRLKACVDEKEYFEHIGLKCKPFVWINWIFFLKIFGTVMCNFGY